MAVTITKELLADAVRVDKLNATVLAQIERLLAFAKITIEQAAPSAPDEIHNEACIRIVGYLFDQPFATPSVGYANAYRNSGAAAILQNYRSIGVGVADSNTIVPSGTGGGGSQPSGGGDSGGGSPLPAIPVTGEFVLEARQQVLLWTEYVALLEHELWGALTTGEAPKVGQAIAVSEVDNTNQRVGIEGLDVLQESDLDDYVTEDDLEDELINYVEQDTLDDTLKPYVTTTELERVLSQIGATGSAIDTDFVDATLTGSETHTYTTDLELDSGTWLINLTLQPSRGQRVTPQLVLKGTDMVVLDFGVIAGSRSVVLSRVLTLTADSTINLRLVSTATLSVSGINLQIFPLSTSATDNTARTTANQARTLAMDANEKTAINANSIASLVNITRDIHTSETRTWKPDGSLAFSPRATGVTTNTYLGNTVRASANQIPSSSTFIIARIPHDSDQSDWRVMVVGARAGDQTFFSSGAIWVRLPAEDATYDYYAVRLIAGTDPSEILGNIASIQLQSDLNSPSTLFGGFLDNDSVGSDQLKDDSVTSDKLVTAVKSLLLPSGGTDGQFLSRSSGSPSWVAAPSGGGGGGERTLLLSQKFSTNLNTNVTSANALLLTAFFEKTTEREVWCELHRVNGGTNEFYATPRVFLDSNIVPAANGAFILPFLINIANLGSWYFGLQNQTSTNNFGVKSVTYFWGIANNAGPNFTVNLMTRDLE